MHLDVVDLRSFYYRTTLGRSAQRAVRDQVQALWPEAKAQTVVGFGFAAPLLRPYLSSARRVTALMPGQQGVMPWPAGMKNVSVLCEETLWPVETDSVDKLVVLHGLETSEHPGIRRHERAHGLADRAQQRGFCFESVFIEVGVGNVAGAQFLLSFDVYIVVGSPIVAR